MKLEVGMYVRTLDGISKVIEVKEEVEHNIMSRFANEYMNIYFMNEIMCDPSFNVIDLIEEGDYVNGMKVNNIAIEDGLIYLHMDADECLHETTMLTGDNIESIVTKEQFEEIKYRVGE